MSTAREQQNMEWKESWRDDYFKWICGFANAQGGRIYIGKNDDGQVVGIANSRKLLEDLPNQVRDLMGILVDVNLYEEAGRDYLEIVVEPYPYPISYRGQYHYRSGSTKQELKGPALSTFLLQKQGKRWDGVPVPGVRVADLSAEAVDLFRQRAARSGRVGEEVLQDSREALLDNLNLVDGDYLKRAAVLLFHPTPEKFVTGAYVKIGFFATDDDLRYQDEVHGPLLLQVERTLDLLQTKYTKARVRYEGASRLEELPFPAAALREALLNALAHKDYSGGTPVQISVYEHQLQFWNEGHLPDSWTVDNLLRKHPSKPFNPDVANTLFRAGYIESWGRGTLKILSECHAVHLPAPRFYFEAWGFVVAFAEYSPAYWQQQGVRADLIPVLLYAGQYGSVTNTVVQRQLGVSKPTATRYLGELEKGAYLQRTGTRGAGTEYRLIGS
jgi:ATP-dependent DNA helicase RecG